MNAKFQRAGGIAALLMPVVLWGGGFALMEFGSVTSLPTTVVRAFLMALGAVSPLLIAIAMAATWRPFGDAGQGVARLAVALLVAALVASAGLYAALGGIEIVAEKTGTRGLQAAGAVVYAVGFGLTLIVGAAMLRQSGPGRGMWIAAGVLYTIAGLMGAPSWGIVAFEMYTADNPTMRVARDSAILLGLGFGTLLFLPLACIVHGVALLKYARAAGPRPA